MSAFDGSFGDMDAEESQATQLIHAALERSPDPSESRGRNGVTVDKMEIPIDSFPSSKHSVANSTRQYHYHGLVATQIDSQLDGDEDSAMLPSEGSQKENFGATGGKVGKDIKWGMPSPDSRPTSPHELAVNDNGTMAGRPGTQGRVTKTKATTVTFLSPIKSPMPPKPAAQPSAAEGKLVFPQSSRQRNTRSHSPVFSEDSFAQGDSQLAEEQFLVTSKKFTTPLADIAGGDDDDFSSEVSRRTKISYNTNYSSRTVVREKDDRPPVILVPSTPSQSGSSDHSRDETSGDKPPPVPQEEDSFEIGQSVNRTILDSDSSKGSQHSQGFDGQEEVAEVQDLYSGMQNTKKGAQPQLRSHDSLYPETQQATQIATQEEPFVPASRSVIPQTNTAFYTNTGPRSLLSTMDPNKRGRYQHLVQLTPATPISPVPQQFPAGTSMMTSDGAETQPSFIPEPRAQNPLRLAPALARAPSPRKPSPKKQTDRQLPPPLTFDAMDVVPDSEPMREQVQSSVTEERISLQSDEASPARNVRSIAKRLSNDSEATEDSDVAVPKKIIRREEEEEEEAPGGKEKRGGEGAESAREDEQEDDDDDDEPLSTRLRKGKGKVLALLGSKPGAVHTYTSGPKSEMGVKKSQAAAPGKQQTRNQKGRQASKNSKTTLADTSHESAVPSSVPDQDHPNVRSRKPSSKAAAAANQAKIKQAQRKSSRATSVGRSTRSGRSATVEAEEDNDVEMEAASDNERATEIANDEGEDDGEEEEYMEPELPQQNLKRKRGRPPKSKSMNQATITPRTRLTKRLKSAGSTMSRMNATRVFALWKQNGLWYPGTVHEHVSDNNYVVRFDDGFEMVVSADNMRTYNLRAGDLVRINKKAKDIKVVKVNHRSNTLVVDLGGEVDELEIKDISVAPKHINSTWQDRLLDNRAIVPAINIIDIKAKPTPSPSRSAASFLSLNAKGSRHSSKFLQKVGLIVSLSGTNTNDKTKDGRSRSEILRAVRDSGGVVVDDLFKYLKMDISYSANRWVIDRSDVQWVGEPKELQRLFLLADDCNTKPKYLMAIALGIPCLSVNWLYACFEAGRELDWHPYLLPQGRPGVIDALPSQQVDLNWGDRHEHLFDIMTNPIASKLLEGQSVLCVGPDMIPKGRDADKAREAASFIVRIILAMGASRVEAVRDATYSANPLSQYDLLILREKELYTRDFVQTHTVDWNWIKDSLIMSRRLTYPPWSVDEDSQCSQSL